MLAASPVFSQTVRVTLTGSVTDAEGRTLQGAQITVDPGDVSAVSDAQGLFTLASLASIVAGTILFKLLAPKGSLWIGNGVQNLSAGVVLLPFAFTLADVGDIVPSARLLGAFAFLTLGGSILAYLLWFHLLKVCGATAASAYHFLMPPLGMLFAWMVLGEHIEVRDLLGIIPVALGIYLVTRPAAASPASPSHRGSTS